MSRVLKNSFSYLSRRTYAVATAEVPRAPALAPATSMPKVAAAAEETGGRVVAKEKEVFWMRDPKTGNWVPENRFSQTDAAEHRDQLLNRTKM